MSRGPDAATLLCRALLASAAAAGCPVALVSSDWTRWASATFTGARHGIALRAGPSPYLDTWLAGLPEAEFAVRGHIVADLTVTAVEREGAWIALALEALTVEER